MTSWRHAQGRLSPPGIRRKYLERMKIAENLVAYAQIKISNILFMFSFTAAIDHDFCLE